MVVLMWIVHVLIQNAAFNIACRTVDGRHNGCVLQLVAFRKKPEKKMDLS